MSFVPIVHKSPYIHHECPKCGGKSGSALIVTHRIGCPLQVLADKKKKLERCSICDKTWSSTDPNHIVHTVSMYGQKAHNCKDNSCALTTNDLNGCTAAAFVHNDMLHMIHNPDKDVVLKYIIKHSDNLQSPVWIKTPSSYYDIKWNAYDSKKYFTEGTAADLMFLPYSSTMTASVINKIGRAHV